MAKALSVINDYEFVSDLDKDEEIKTKWILRSLTGREFLRCVQNGIVDHELIINYGLIGWKDFPDEDGKDIEFNLANIDRIPSEYLAEISFKLQEMAQLQDDEIKNS